MSEPSKPLAADDDRSLWMGVAVGVLGGGVSGAVCTVIYLSAAFMDRSSDRVVWQFWLGGSAGLTLACIATGVIFAAVRQRSLKVWSIPAVLLMLPTLLLLIL